MSWRECLSRSSLLLRCLILREKRANGLFSVYREGDRIVYGALLDQRFNYLLPKLDKESIEYLWARDLGYCILGLDVNRLYSSVPSERYTVKERGETKKEYSDIIIKHLSINVKGVLEKARKANIKEMVTNIMNLYPELA